MYSYDSKRLAQVHQQRFYEYISTGRLYKIRLLLEDESCDIDVNGFDENAMTPLMLACALDDDKVKTRNQILRLLLDKGADLNITDQRGVSVFSWACKSGKLDIVKLFIKKVSVDIDFNAADFRGDTALMYAVRSQNAPLVRILVKTMRKMDVNIDKRNHSDVTPYLEAKRIGNEEIVEILRNDGKASESLQICPLFQNDISLVNDHVEIKDNGSLVRATLASKMRQTLSQQNRREWIRYKKTWIQGDNEVNSVGAKNQRNVSRPAKSAGNSTSKVTDGKTESDKDRKTTTTTTKTAATTNEFPCDGQGLSDNSKNLDTVLADNASHGMVAKIVRKTEHMEINDVEDNQCEGPNDEMTSEHKQVEAELTKGSDSCSDNLITTQPRIRTSESEDGKDDDVFSNAMVDKFAKNILQKRLQKRAYRKKSSLEDLQEQVGQERTLQSEMLNRSTSSSGLGLRIMSDTPTSQLLRGRKTSNLSVSCIDDVISRSRPSSGRSAIESRRHNVVFKRPLSAEPRPKLRISYEDIYQLCPEMRKNGKRHWYSDLQWMLALKAHQDSPTYLPAQPERQSLNEVTTSDVKIEIDSVTRSRRPSVIGDAKRPALRKRQTASMSFKGN